MTALGPAHIRADQNPAARLRAARARLNRIDYRANTALKVFCVVACAFVFLVMVALVFKVIDESRLAIGHFGAGLFFHNRWIPQESQFGLLPLIFDTLVTSVVSLVIATALGVSIGIFLAMIAPRRLATFIGPAVEMLAAVPSVIYGLIGLIAVAPFLSKHIEGPIHAVLGWIPLFGPAQLTGNSVFTACVVLTFMVLPIISALCRDIFLTVPAELTAGAEALGATRWEVIRGVVLPTTKTGIISACVLGFGRALGEAIAVTQVIGGQTRISANLFNPGDTMASRIASEFSGSTGPLNTSVLYSCAAVLLLFGLVTNLLASRIARGGSAKASKPPTSTIADAGITSRFMPWAKGSGAPGAAVE